MLDFAVAEGVMLDLAATEGLMPAWQWRKR
jgi:hypothetical protein